MARPSRRRRAQRLAVRFVHPPAPFEFARTARGVHAQAEAPELLVHDVGGSLEPHRGVPTEMSARCRRDEPDLPRRRTTNDDTYENETSFPPRWRPRALHCQQPELRARRSVDAARVRDATPQAGARARRGRGGARDCGGDEGRVYRFGPGSERRAAASHRDLFRARRRADRVGGIGAVDVRVGDDNHPAHPARIPGASYASSGAAASAVSARRLGGFAVSGVRSEGTARGLPGQERASAWAMAHARGYAKEAVKTMKVR